MMLYTIVYPQDKIDFLFNKSFQDLYQFLKTLHLKQGSQFFKQCKFGGTLTADEIGNLLVNKLNSRDNLSGDVYAYILNLFDIFISLRIFAHFKKKIKPEFYQRLGPIFSSLISLWKQNESTPHGNQIKTTTLIFLIGIYRLGSNGDLKQKIYNQNFVKAFVEFSPPDDTLTIQVYIYFVVSGGNRYKPQFQIYLKKVLSLLKYQNFTLDMIQQYFCHLCYAIVHVDHELEWSVQIINSLKEKIRNNFGTNQNTALSRMVYMVIKISQKVNKQCFQWQQLLQYCRLSKDNSLIYKNHLYMKLAVRKIIQFQEKYLKVKSQGFVGLACYAQGLILFLQAIESINSTCLILLMQTNFLQILKDTIFNPARSVYTRDKAQQIIYKIGMRLKQINQVVYDQYFLMVQYISNVPYVRPQNQHFQVFYRRKYKLKKSEDKVFALY